MDIKGKTKTGFAYKVPEENLNNYELLELISEIETNPLVASTVMRMLLGSEQTKKLKEHVRDENGIVAADKMMEEFQDIFQGPEIKK
ncbi:hypothetical protein BG261_02790 [Floricoccus tropicus]|uniref:Phage protein n=1 Tax=Floricoccus tropicus TaxID=1859473 RepID=A0A1E8GPI6_9LACT|nr:hypothetical protein [Floricoccus tropicus]OFI49523.1 hypothetical protein BG261_02790 [Floricoccus tropicus]